MKKNLTPSLPITTRWIPSTVALAATGGIAHSATVQITFTNNIVSTTAGVASLNPDIGGDGVADVAGVAGVASVSVNFPGYAIRARTKPSYGSYPRVFTEEVNSSTNFSFTSINSRHFLSFTTNIPGLGAKTGFLDFRIISNPAIRSIQLNRFVFDDVSSTASSYSAGTTYPEYSAVPEASTGLLGLAAGAAGLMRRRRAAATR